MIGNWDLGQILFLFVCGGRGVGEHGALEKGAWETGPDWGGWTGEGKEKPATVFEAPEFARPLS